MRRSRWRRKRRPGILPPTGSRAGTSCNAPEAAAWMRDVAAGRLTRYEAPPGADHLLTAAAVRERCGLVFAAAERGETRHFALALDRLDDTVARVVSATCRR